MSKCVHISILLVALAGIGCGGVADPATVPRTACTQMTALVAAEYDFCELRSGAPHDPAAYKALQVGYWEQAGCLDAVDYEPPRKVPQYCRDWAAQLDCTTLLASGALPTLPADCAAPFLWQ
jgi:hypothetical protein